MSTTGVAPTLEAEFEFAPEFSTALTGPLGAGLAITPSVVRTTSYTPYSYEVASDDPENPTIVTEPSVITTTEVAPQATFSIPLGQFFSYDVTVGPVITAERDVTAGTAPVITVEPGFEAGVSFSPPSLFKVAKGIAERRGA